MDDSDDPQRAFVRRIGDEVVSNSLESQWAAGQIGPAMPLMRKRDQGFKRLIDLLNYTVRCGYVVGGDVVPNLVKVVFSFGVKCVTAHEPGLARRAALLSRI